MQIKIFTGYLVQGQVSKDIEEQVNEFIKDKELKFRTRTTYCEP
jgi:hypothetical protein